MILLIDNYDSFFYNLYQLIGSIRQDIRVIRNDELTVEEIAKLPCDHIVLSPGPGKPKEVGICEDAVRAFAGKIPILGVCLGHQAICEVYGATVTYAKRLMHGKQSVIRLDVECPVFEGLPLEVPAARYHSLAALPDTLPQELKITAVTGEGEVMAVAHRDYQVYGLQFHPESILTPDGEVMIRNFLQCKENR